MVIDHLNESATITFTLYLLHYYSHSILFSRLRCFHFHCAEVLKRYIDRPIILTVRRKISSRCTYSLALARTLTERSSKRPWQNKLPIISESTSLLTHSGFFSCRIYCVTVSHVEFSEKYGLSFDHF